MRLPGLGGWSEDPLWSYVYPWLVENETVGGGLWRLGTGSDLSLLHDTAREVATLPAGSRVLDVPTGSGVALRWVRPGQGLRYVAADISATMLARGSAAASRRGVSEQVTTCLADVGALPFEDDGFDLVLSLTGLHCFPDPHRAVREMVRVLRPGGVLTGSALCTDSGRRHEPLRRAGRAAGVLGPMCTSDEIGQWLLHSGCRDVAVTRHGAFAYFRALAP